MTTLPLYLLSFVTTVMSFFPVTKQATFDPEKHLIAYYSFNDCDARDDSGNESHGMIHGRPSCWCGIEDDGLQFDGQRDFIEFSGIVNDYFTTSDFTVSFYIKPESNSIFSESLLSKRANCDLYYMFDIQLNNAMRMLEVDVHERPTKFYKGLETELDASGWNHVVLVREGFTAITYINGSPRKISKRCSGLDVTNEVLLSFGNSPCVGKGGSRRFKGILDELRIYDKALTDEEVKLLYAYYPVESADMDCYTKNLLPKPFQNKKTAYLCSLQ